MLESADLSTIPAITEIIRNSKAWIKISDLSEPASVATLVANGVLSLWPELESVTLSVLAASVLGVRIEEFNEIPRWVSESYVTPSHTVSRVRISRGEKLIHMIHPNYVVDRRPGPLEVLINQEGDPVTLWGQVVRIDPRLRARQIERRRSKMSRRTP